MEICCVEIKVFGIGQRKPFGFPGIGALCPLLCDIKMKYNFSKKVRDFNPACSTKALTPKLFEA